MNTVEEYALFVDFIRFVVLLLVVVGILVFAYFFLTWAESTRFPRSSKGFTKLLDDEKRRSCIYLLVKMQAFMYEKRCKTYKFACTNHGRESLLMQASGTIHTKWREPAEFEFLKQTFFDYVRADEGWKLELAGDAVVMSVAG